MNTNKSLTPYLLKLICFIGIVLLIPLVAMQLSQDVIWTASDFITAGALLFITGLTYRLITFKWSNMAYKAAVGLSLLSALFLIWVNLAVGIIGSENNAINLLYFGVIGIGIAGAFMAHAKPLGMSLTMLTVAAAQIIVTLFALISGMQHVSGSSITEIIGINSFFVIVFMFSALLFKYAHRQTNLGIILNDN